jgi:DNA-directed RNA polymerase subunit RPC12/RpoP
MATLLTSTTVAIMVTPMTVASRPELPTVHPIALPEYECLRCGNKWHPRKAEVPERCGRCKSPYWFKPRIRPVKRHGRNGRKRGAA